MPAPLNANELRLSTPAVPMFMVDVSLWLAEMLSFNHTSLTQNRNQKETPEEIQTLWLQQDVSE